MILSIPPLQFFAEEDRENNKITRLYSGTMRANIGTSIVIAYQPRKKSSKVPCAVVDDSHGIRKTFTADTVMEAYLKAASYACNLLPG